MTRAQEIIDEILRREGSTYSNRRADRGGPTKYGITLATLRRRLWPVSVRSGSDATATDVRRLTESDARAIYRFAYVIRPGFDRLPAPLDDAVIDAGVLSGPTTAGRWLQDACNDLGEKLRRDGAVGPLTLAAVGRHHPGALALLVTSHQAVLMGGLISRSARAHCDDQAQGHNALGWARRLHERHLAAARAVDEGRVEALDRGELLDACITLLEDLRDGV